MIIIVKLKFISLYLKDFKLRYKNKELRTVVNLFKNVI